MRFLIILFLPLTLLCCDDDIEVREFTFSGKIMSVDDNNTNPAPLSNTKVNINFYKKSFDPVTETDFAMTDASGSYTFSKRMPKDEFEGYSVEVIGVYRRNCGEWDYPTAEYMQLESLNNVKNINACRVSMISVIANKLNESLTTTLNIVSKTAYVVNVGLPFNSDQVVNFYYFPHVSEVEFTFQVRNQYGELLKETITKVEPIPMMTKMVNIDF